MAIRRALEDEAEFLGADLDWQEIVPLIASIDWLSAAVIAQHANLKIPGLPSADDLLKQRALRPLGRVTIGVVWGDEMHELQMSFERWVRILGGAPRTVEEPYWYEGERFTACWAFDGRRGIEVTYDDGGVGWDGELDDADVIAGAQVDGVDVAWLALRAASRG